jgi:hypothetical protein
MRSEYAASQYSAMGSPPIAMIVCSSRSGVNDGRHGLLKRGIVENFTTQLELGNDLGRPAVRRDHGFVK